MSDKKDEEKQEYAGNQAAAVPPPLPAMPEAPSGTPPGLEYLCALDQVLIQQQVELVEAIANWEAENKYAIKNISGQQCYFALETSGCCSRQCCSNKRAFVIKIVDNSQRECVLIRRNFNCCAQSCCWLPCCGICQHEIVVECPPGTEIGRVHNSCGFLRSTFVVELGEERIAYIKSPLCIKRGCCICLDVTFQIFSAVNDEKIGCIKKQFSGLIKEAFTDADNFSLTFPKDLDVRAKAILLSSVFLIDFMYYEEKPKEKLKVVDKD